MQSPTRDRSPAWTSKQPGKARSTPGKPKQPMPVVQLKRMSFAKPRVETHRRRNKRKSHTSAPLHPYTSVRGGSEEGARLSRSPRDGVQQRVVPARSATSCSARSSNSATAPRSKTLQGREPGPSPSPHACRLCAGRQRRRGSDVKPPRGLCGDFVLMGKP